MRVVKADLGAGVDGTSVSPSQFRMLCRLAQGRATVSELAAWNAVTLPTATKILDVLVERGWVERNRSQEDRRLVHVHLTPRGREVQTELEARAADSLSAVLSQVPAESAAPVRETLDVLGPALDQAEAQAAMTLEEEAAQA